MYSHARHLDPTSAGFPLGDDSVDFERLSSAGILKLTPSPPAPLPQLIRDQVVSDRNADRANEPGARGATAFQIRSLLSRFLLALVVSLTFTPSLQAQRFVRRTKLRVTAPTTIDWVYAATGVSHAEIPEQVTPGYKSTAQQFDLYAPVDVAGAGPFPVILFLSYRSTPMGWDRVGPTCLRDGVIYVEPHRVGNSRPSAERIRIALDCFDQVRRNFPTDPDRTYIAGYSGGGNMAAQIAMMLPEYFGGLIASNMTVGLPPTAWHRDRMANRLSIASIVGENEPPGFEMSRIHTPILQAFGIRARCHVLPRRGHSAPPPEPFDAAFRWLEQASAERSRSADERPILKIAGVVSREQQAAATLEDSKSMLEQADTIPTGLQMLAEIKRRWPDLVVADEAADLLAEYASRTEQPWLAQERAEQLETARLLATIYEQAAQVRSGITPRQRAMYAANAIANDEIIASQSDDQEEVKRATERIETLLPLTQSGRNSVRR